VGPLPAGFAGGPVFVAQPHGNLAFRLLCVGLIASADRNPNVITFDTIRSLIEDLVREQRPKRRLFRRR
jgi:hypothetical protein